MENLNNLEFVAAIFGVLGAWATSWAAQNKGEKARILWLISGAGFACGNLLLFVLASELGLSAMALQMIFFGVSSSLLLWTRSSKILAMVTLFAMVLVISTHLDVFLREMHFGLDVYPSILAIIGSFLLSVHARGNVPLLTGFSLFIAADILYLVIAFQNSLPWFFIQTAAYLVFSAIAIKAMVKESRCDQQVQMNF